ncbi:single-stranded DNA-binding protein [Babesia caballi]|uniref:Single-stranded DNA-binding protein n=1 Tax=Babesia caballi TaxID=5871 RepID=A0AAV4LTL4_BABCB|nr:single-stranded DNA-binding protein [Babesia caballi]
MPYTHINAAGALLLAAIMALLVPGSCVRTPLSTTSVAFVSLAVPSNASVPSFRAQAEGFDSPNVGENEEYREDTGAFMMDDEPRNSDPMQPTVNTVTICGRIGFIDKPVSLGNGFKALRLAVATNERGRMGAVKTLWHKVVLYGQNNVDYVQSRARVGDQALVVGTLSYYTPQSQDGTSYRAKIAEVAVRYRGAGHSFILMPRSRQPGDDYSDPGVEEETYSYNNA